MRKGAAKPRLVVPDAKFGDEDVMRVIRKVMYGGKMSLAERLVYGALEQVAKASGEDPVHVLRRALANITPDVEVKSKRVGGANLQVPIEVYPRRRKSLAVRWLVSFARSRRERGFATRLAQEILDAYNERGGAFKRKTDVHRMAEANRTFSSFQAR